MIRPFIALLAVTALFSGCRNDSGIRGYWSEHPVDVEDYAAAEEVFADFAELAVQAPLADAKVAVDRLLKKAAKDEVAFYIYADWMDRGFGAIASPCHSCPIYVYAVDKMLRQGILSDGAAERYALRRESCLHNQVGAAVELPEMKDADGMPVEYTPGVRTLFLLVDQNCPSCRGTMQLFDTPRWADTALVALCYGYGPLPDLPQWTCYRIGSEQLFLDLREAPYYFVAAADGSIEITYTSAHNAYEESF